MTRTIAMAVLALVACKGSSDESITIKFDEGSKRHAASLGDRLVVDEDRLGRWRVGDAVDEAALRETFTGGEKITRFEGERRWSVQQPASPLLVASFYDRSGLIVDCQSLACRTPAGVGVGSTHEAPS